MPTTLITYDNKRLTPAQYPEVTKWTAGKFGASLTMPLGTVVGKKTADGLLYPYASGNADGTQVAVGFVMMNTWTDAAGLCYFNGSAVASPLNVPEQTAPYFQGGVFDTADLVGWDATAKTSSGARTLANGFIDLPM